MEREGVTEIVTIVLVMGKLCIVVDNTRYCTSSSNKESKYEGVLLWTSAVSSYRS